MKFSKLTLVFVLAVSLVLGSNLAAYGSEILQPVETIYTCVVVLTAEVTTEPTTEIIIEEEPPLGLPVNFDQIYEVPEVFEDPILTTEYASEIILEGEIPLAVALPQTGQLSPDILFGIGSLISLAGLWIKRRK